MIPSLPFLKKRLHHVILCKEKQGFKTAGMLTSLKKLPDSYDAVVALARRVATLPLRQDWPYREPNDLASIWQECGLLINSARFAESTAHAFGMQVAQGCDTDCFGEIIGSIMGAYFGPGYLDERWLAPFSDDLRTSLGDFHERSLSAVTERMARLPHYVTGDESGDAGRTA